VSFDDWLLALHVLSAFALVAGVVVYWVLIVAARQADAPERTIHMEPVARVGNAATAIGWGGTIALGVWLAFSVGGYDIWDAWIIAALVLWVIAMPLGQRTGAAYVRAVKKARDLQAAGRTGPDPDLLALNRKLSRVLLHFLTSVVVLLILVDMIWKPGA
jgi:hypothetical protein